VTAPTHQTAVTQRPSRNPVWDATTTYIPPLLRLGAVHSTFLRLGAFCRSPGGRHRPGEAQPGLPDRLRRQRRLPWLTWEPPATGWTIQDQSLMERRQAATPRLPPRQPTSQSLEAGMRKILSRSASRCYWQLSRRQISRPRHRRRSDQPGLQGHHQRVAGRAWPIWPRNWPSMPSSRADAQQSEFMGFVKYRTGGGIPSHSPEMARPLQYRRSCRPWLRPLFFHHTAPLLGHTAARPARPCYELKLATHTLARSTRWRASRALQPASAPWHEPGAPFARSHMRFWPSPDRSAARKQTVREGGFEDSAAPRLEDGDAGWASPTLPDDSWAAHGDTPAQRSSRSLRPLRFVTPAPTQWAAA